MKQYPVIAGVVLGFCLSFTVQAAELLVPSQYSTIQGAIDAAADGDTITVATGQYIENLNFEGKAITLTSTNPQDPDIVEATIIDANDLDIGVAFWSFEGSDSVLTGFTITNGTNSFGYGGGIYCNSTSPTISYCVIENNTVQNSGGGIYLDSSDAIIEYCTIRNNTADHAGGVAINDGYPIFRFCTIENNTGKTGNAGGIYYGGDGELTLSDCTFTGNTAKHGGGVNIWRGTALIQRCLIQDNSATSNGGGIYNFESETTIRLCTLRENTTYNGGAIFLQKSESEIYNCLLTGNEATNGGGIYTEQSDAVIETCTIVGNRAVQFGGGGYFNYTSNAELQNNIFWLNEAANQGDQIAIGPSGDTDTSVSYCDIQGGQVLVIDLNGGTNTLDWGEGNLDVDPNFFAYGYWDPNGTVGDWTDDFWVQGDYRLRGLSECINAGDPDFESDDDDTDLAGNARIIHGIVDMGAYESSHPLVTKMTVKAGKTRDAQADSCSISGTIANLAENLENSEYVIIGVGPHAESIERNKFNQAGKKVKYIYKNSTPGFTAVTFDFTKGTFSITGKNLNLSGMAAPVILEIIIDGYYGLAIAQDDGAEDAINGKKYMPMQLLQGQMDSLRVDKVKAKASRDGNTVASLMVQGAIASAGNPDLILSGLVIHWGGGQYSLAGAVFDRKAANKYIAKKKPEGLDQSSANISLDFIKSTFKITLKNTDLAWQDGSIEFGLVFDTYEQFREVTY